MKSKEKEYASKIMLAMNELFNDESDFFIGTEELQKGDNLTDFFHAISNLAPNFIYNKITGEELHILDFNHLANKLVYQYKK